MGGRRRPAILNVDPKLEDEPPRDPLPFPLHPLHPPPLLPHQHPLLPHLLEAHAHHLRVHLIPNKAGRVGGRGGSRADGAEVEVAGGVGAGLAQHVAAVDHTRGVDER